MWQKVAKFKGAEYFRKALYSDGSFDTWTGPRGRELTLLDYMCMTMTNSNLQVYMYKITVQLRYSVYSRQISRGPPSDSRDWLASLFISLLPHEPAGISRKILTHLTTICFQVVTVKP